MDRLVCDDAGGAQCFLRIASALRGLVVGRCDAAGVGAVVRPTHTFVAADDPEALAAAVAEQTAPPTVEEAMERLAGRRADAIEREAAGTWVASTVGQSRRTRRNNLRVARAENRARAKAAALSTTVLLTDPAEACVFAKPPTDELSPERGTVTLASIDRVAL